MNEFKVSEIFYSALDKIGLEAALHQLATAGNWLSNLGKLNQKLCKKWLTNITSFAII